MPCKYYLKCDSYNPDSGTCKDENAERGYCGIYRRFLRQDSASLQESRNPEKSRLLYQISS
ncbi:MAG: hypothetical protein KKB21_02875 [Nanoarchaeota archaeon]|nr:hypothetical protein [Nanoarchaeota archaeon]